MTGIDRHEVDLALQPLVTPILDVMQTIPSFVYLLPAIAFFSIGKPPGILATVIFSMPPMVRLTDLGIRQVPESTKEVALAFGANPKQLLRKVEPVPPYRIGRQGACTASESEI